MTPDTAALRALADAASGWPIDVSDVWALTEPMPGLDYPDLDAKANADFIAACNPDTVRALCDAADEVERLRAEVERWKAKCEAAWTRGDEDAVRIITYRAERDASRTAHSALVAGLRALETNSGGEDYEHNESCDYGHGGAPECPRCWWLTIAALLDRHGRATGHSTRAWGVPG